MHFLTLILSNLNGIYTIKDNLLNVTFDTFQNNFILTTDKILYSNEILNKYYKQITINYNNCLNTYIFDKKNNIVFDKYYIDKKYLAKTNNDNIILQIDFNNDNDYIHFNYDKILDILNIKKKQEDVKEEYNSLFNKKTIAVHFRIGDYVGLQHNHPIMLLAYYENAFKHLENNLENIKDGYDILYFCQKQDNNIVNNYIKAINKDRGYNFVKISDDIPDWKQLLLMSLCDNFIIANSTFSWFGAYFSENINKNILYPSIWFGESLNHDTKDICPESWIKIKAN